MYLCKFGQNPSNGSEDNVQKTILEFQNAGVTLKIRSSSPSYSTLPFLQTVYVCKVGQNPSTGSEDNAWKPFFGLSKCLCDLKNLAKVTKI